MSDIKIDIRWRQRFENFELAFKFLEKCTKIETPTDVERAGLIQSFEMAFELSWKVLQDYLESIGYSIHGPRNIIKQAYQDRIIEDAHIWMEALDDRNLTVHTYEEIVAEKVELLIKQKYFQMLKKLYIRFSKENI